MKHSERPLYGLVLGGGKSRRMGQDKATLDYHGKPQLQAAFEALSPFCDKTFVGIREEQAQQEPFANLPQIWDAYPGQGPLAAILSAQQKHPEAAWFVLACDLPLLDENTLRHLIANRRHDGTATAYLSHHDGRAEPLCAIYEPESAPLLAARFSEGLRCARRGLESLSPATLTLPNAQALENANTPEERQSFLAGLGKVLDASTMPAAPPASTPKATRRLRANLYAQLRETLGRSIEIETPWPAKEDDVIAALCSGHAPLAPLIRRCRIAAHDSYLLPDETLPETDEIDVIAPVSGG